MNKRIPLGKCCCFFNSLWTSKSQKRWKRQLHLGSRWFVGSEEKMKLNTVKNTNMRQRKSVSVGMEYLMKTKRERLLLAQVLQVYVSKLLNCFVEMLIFCCLHIIGSQKVIDQVFYCMYSKCKPNRWMTLPVKNKIQFAIQVYSRCFKQKSMYYPLQIIPNRRLLIFFSMLCTFDYNV